MTEDAKPSHPPPWRWVAPDVGEPDRGFLVAANGARVLSIALGHDPGDETILPASPYVRAVTELAPELADAFASLMQGAKDGSPPGVWGDQVQEDLLLGIDGHRTMNRLRALLAKLDEARKAGG